MCISDVIVMLSHCAPPAGMFDSRQSLFSACYRGMVEATRRVFFWMTLVKTG